jgi:hypothetical protein
MNIKIIVRDQKYWWFPFLAINTKPITYDILKQKYGNGFSDDEFKNYNTWKKK